MKHKTQGTINSYIKYCCCFCFVFQEPTATPIPSIKKKCAKCWCQKRESLLQDRLPVKFQDVKLKDRNFKHEIFLRIDMKHSYFSNDLFAINFFCC